MPNFRLLGSIIKKVPEGSRYPEAEFYLAGMKRESVIPVHKLGSNNRVTT